MSKNIKYEITILYSTDALADTFYSVGFVMTLCQLLSILELFHIADGIEKARLLPRFVQVSITAQLCRRNPTSNAFIHLMWLKCLTGSGEEHPADRCHHAGGDAEQTSCVCPVLFVEHSGSLTV